MIVNSAENLVLSRFTLVDLEHFPEDEARKRFDDFQKQGVIRNGTSYDDDVWMLTDEYSNVGFHFKFDPFCYSNFKDVFQTGYREFLSYVKAFTVSLLGRNALSSISDVILDLRHILASSYEDVCSLRNPKHLSSPALCSDFFSMLPESDDNDLLSGLMEALDAYNAQNIFSRNRNKRALSDFDTYFKFNDIMHSFWQSQMPDDDRLFYYPLYLWWSVTAVIPLRPREFLLTPRDCLTEDKDGYKLTLMRNGQKGARKNVSYRISDDYFKTTYPIPEPLAMEFRRYLSMTAEYDHTDLDTLFITDTHYEKWAQKKHSNSRFLTYVNLTTILHYFYSEVIVGQFRYRIVGSCDRKHPDDDEIGMIHLGDTRHLAIINLMQEGGTPAAAMYLAGHTNEEMSAHYGSNITELIECKTYREYRRLTGGERKYSISRMTTLPPDGDGVILSDKGKCYSTAYAGGEIDDCLNAVGPNGEIGYCPDCVYHRKSMMSFFGSDDIYRRQIDEDYEAVKKAVQAVRSEKEDYESIGQAMMKLHSSSVSYQKFLMSQYSSPDTADETDKTR